jgi:hypothetical protein
MSIPDDQPINVPIPAENCVMLTKPFYVEGHVIPPGFKWNGQSVPWYFWCIAGSPFEPDSLAASCLHDWLYATGDVEKTEADFLFFELCYKNGVGGFRSTMKWFALWWKGSKAWKSCRDGCYPDNMEKLIALRDKIVSEDQNA